MTAPLIVQVVLTRDDFDPDQLWWADGSGTITNGDMLCADVRKQLARAGMPVEKVDLVT